MLAECQNCGSTQLIKAHLIPKAFATEVQVGKAHAAQITANGQFIPSQSGLWDNSILCAACDGQLGVHEHYAVEALRRVRNATAKTPLGVCDVRDFDGDRFLRFCAGLLWKYAISAKTNPRPDLGPYLSTLQSIAFENASIPHAIDAYIFRPRLHEHDETVAYYQAPYFDRAFYKEVQVRMYRFAVGGCIVRLKVDKREAVSNANMVMGVRGHADITVVVSDARSFRDYQVANELARTPRLSQFLDRHGTT